MLLRTEIRRRTQSLNNYISLLQQKIDRRSYREALLHIRKNKNNVENSYLAPHDPNMYYLDSLKARQEKLFYEIDRIEKQIQNTSNNIEKLNMKRGYEACYQNSKGQFQDQAHYNKNRKYQLDLQEIQEIKQHQEFINKVENKNVGIFITRFRLTLEDIDKVDFQFVTVLTNYHTIRISYEDQEQETAYLDIMFDKIIHFQECYDHLLISWINSKNTENYMLMFFNNDQVKDEWYQIIKLCKVIQQAKLKKTKIFQPIEEKNQSPQKTPPESEPQQEINQTTLEVKRPEANSSLFNMSSGHIRNPIRIPGHERIRRQSEFQQLARRSEVRFDPKLRKVSEDLTLREHYLNEKKLNTFKSQKSFEDNSQSNSYKGKQEEKEDDKTSPFLKKLSIPEQSRIESTPHSDSHKFDNNHAFVTSSIINWIQEEHEDDRSKSSNQSHGLKFNNEGQKSLTVFNEDEDEKGNSQKLEESQHISEDPAEIEESPMLPQNLKKKSDLTFKLFKVEKEHKDQDSKGEVFEDEGRSQNTISVHEKHNISKSRERESQEVEEPEQEQDQQENEEKSEDQEEQENEGQDQQSSNLSQKLSEQFRFDILETGLKVWKCSNDAWNPHKKQLYLSKNHKDILYKEEKGNEIKKIEFSQIQGIFYKFKQVGITKHIKKDLDINRCLTIKCHEGKKKIKNYQFYLLEDINPKQMAAFATNLTNYIEYLNNKF